MKISGGGLGRCFLIFTFVKCQDQKERTYFLTKGLLILSWGMYCTIVQSVHCTHNVSTKSGFFVPSPSLLFTICQHWYYPLVYQVNSVQPNPLSNSITIQITQKSHLKFTKITYPFIEKVWLVVGVTSRKFGLVSRVLSTFLRQNSKQFEKLMLLVLTLVMLTWL